MNTTATLVTSVKMTLKRETKGTFVYENTDPDTTIPTLYIRKSAFNEGAPTTIKVIVEEA